MMGNAFKSAPKVITHMKMIKLAELTVGILLVKLVITLQISVLNVTKRNFFIWGLASIGAQNHYLPIL